MLSTATSEQAAVFARMAFQRMEREGVTPSPEHFAVWFNYYSGTHPDLTRAVDMFASGKQGINDEICNVLFERFFGWEHESRRLRETSEAIQQALDQVTSVLEQAGTDTDRFNRSLDSFSTALGGAGGAEQLRKALVALAAETRTVLEHNRMLTSRLNVTAKQVAQMRQDLEETQRESMTDGLTGIANRRYFDLRLRNETADADEAGHALSLVLIDIDHFKKFNDTHGHQTGDEVLRLVAKVLKDSVKGRDTTARFGGEEFAIILPMTNMQGAGIVAEQIRKAVESKKIVRRNTGESLGTITMSLGITEYIAREPLTAFIERADKALYAAKHKGRNRVEFCAATVERPLQTA